MLDAFHYSAYGLHIESQIELPELSPYRGRVDVLPPVRIAQGPVHSSLPGGLRIGARAQVIGNQALITVESVATFHISAGSNVTIEPAAGSDSTVIRHYLLGPVLGALLVQRGILALHASAIEVDGRGIAFVGPTGIGKSTLAAYLHRRGHRLICDDACVVEETPTGMQTWFGIPKLKLWFESVAAMGGAHTALQSVLPGLEKYYLPTGVPQTESGVPAPIRAIYLIQPTEPHAASAIVPINGIAALKIIRQNIHGRNFHVAIHGESHFLSRCMAIQRRLPLYLMPVHRGFHRLEEACARLDDHLADTQTRVNHP